MSQARHVGKIVVRAPAGEAAKAPPAGTVVVTGGLGSLGSLTAAWVAHSSRLQVLATGRTGRFAADVAASAGSSSSLAGLVAGGFAGLLTMTSADAAAAEDAGLLLASGPGSAGVVGILHAAGVLADATLRNQSLAGLRTAWAPKVAALQQLGGGYGRQPGAFQLLFSSIAALLGSPGQANYSAANATLDAMAQATQAQVSRAALAIGVPSTAQSTALGLMPVLTCCFHARCLACRAWPAAACSGAPGRARAWRATTPPRAPAWSAQASAWWRALMGWQRWRACCCRWRLQPPPRRPPCPSAGPASCSSSSRRRRRHPCLQPLLTRWQQLRRLCPLLRGRRHASVRRRGASPASSRLLRLHRRQPNGRRQSSRR